MTTMLITSAHVESMGTLAGAPPNKVVAFKLKLTIDKNDQINIGYTWASTFSLSGQMTIDDVLRKLARDPDDIPSRWRDVHEDNGPSNSNLSVHNDDFCHVVFVLERQNWQFTVHDEPFRIAERKTKYFTDPKCAWLYAGGVELARNPGDFSAKNPNVDFQPMVAAFIANNADDVGDNPRPDKHVDFNIYLELRLPGKDANNNSVTKLLPIVFDPDVGYPGGHT